MKTIGITGGVGAGKSEVLKYIQENYKCKIIIADALAYELESPGNICYEEILDLIGRDTIDENGLIIKNQMAKKIFENPDLLESVNAIIHPAVKRVIIEKMELEKQRGEIDYFFVEAALLIEEGYDRILDELWYIRADEDIRRDRLKQSRGYSDEKIDNIFASQLDDSIFLEKCKVIIDNGSELNNTFEQIKKALN